MAAATFRVVLVRPPDDGLPESSTRMSGAAILPVELLATEDGESARVLFHRLQSEGANVVLLQDLGEGTCRIHPPQLLGRSCRDCGAPICAVCRLDAGGHRLCADCLKKDRERVRLLRVRRSFFVFLFVAFCYFAYDFWRGEQARLDPKTTIDVAIFQVLPVELVDEPLLRTLNDPDGVWGLSQIAAWFNREHRRYTTLDRPAVHIRLYGPWTEAVEPPPLATEGDSPWRMAWLSFQYPRYFHELARRRGEEPDDHDARVYVIYGDGQGDLAAHSRGSAKGRIAVAFVSLLDPNPAYAQVTVAHELAHILGAEDLYDPTTFLPTYPEGYVEPHREPKLPQRFAELMAVDRPVDPTHELEVRSMEEVRIGYHTAAMMRWISPEQAELLYRTPR